MLDRFGPKRVMIFGVIVTGFGFILMSQMQTLWHFYASVLLLALGMSFGTFIVFVATVGNWFVRRRAKAFSTLMTFSAVGAVVLPLLVWIIDTYTWRPALFGIGVGFWIIGIPVAFMMRRRPEDYGQLPDGDSELRVADGTGGTRRPVREISIGVREVLRLRAFWQISIAVSVGQLVSSTNLFHLPALIDYEIGAWLAATAAGAVAIGDILGRVSIGFIGDRFDKKILLTLSFLIQMVGVGAPLIDQPRIPRHRMGTHPPTHIRPRLRTRFWRLHTAPTRHPRRLLRTTKLRLHRRHRKLRQRHLRHHRTPIRRTHVRLHRFLPTRIRHHGIHDADRHTSHPDTGIPNPSSRQSPPSSTKPRPKNDRPPVAPSFKPTPARRGNPGRSGKYPLSLDGRGLEPAPGLNRG